MSEGDTVRSLWGERAKELIYSLDTVEKTTWIMHPVLRRCIAKAISSDENIDEYDLVKTQFNRQFERCLVLAPGSGSLERALISMGIAKTVDGYDISPVAVEEAKKQASEMGISEFINYGVMDLNHATFSPESYDLVVSHMAIHHISNLEHILGEVKKTLKHDGLFWVNEYVGPSRYQFSDKQIQLMNWILDQLPNKYKKDVINGKIKGPCYREKEEDVIRSDPSESVRSAEIVGLLEKEFVPIIKREYGGTLLQFALANIVGNFDPNKMKDKVILKMLYEFEKLLIQEKIIKSDFIFMLLKKKE